MTTAVDRVQWLTDLVRLEILLWERVDARLKQQHDLPLAHFEVLHVLRQAPDGNHRVGDLAQRLRITVGGASKLVDRVEATGLIRRTADPGDRRASRVTLTPQGNATLEAATQTYAATLANALDTALSDADQLHLHDLVRQLITATG
jgi:MarR family transcriptional regulator, organic hydroperoxide resistance regulator